MSRHRILVVEDDEAMAGGISDVLELAGYEVQTAHNGREGLAALDGWSPDLIVSDIMMPEMDGYDLFKGVRARPELISIPFIYLTAKGQKVDIRQGKTMGAEDYLVKPFDWEDLLVAVKSRLERFQEIRTASETEIATLKNRILNTLSHEFRTPLTYISGYADLLQDKDLPPADLQHFLKRLQSGSMRLSRLVEDFLFLVSLQAGEAEMAYRLQRDHFAGWSTLVERVLANHADKAAARRVTFSSQVDASIPGTMLHAAFVESAVSRLVDNAVKFTMNKPGDIHVEVSARDGGVQIAVSDEGIGINSEHLPTIFEPFHQIDREKHEQQGAGVGLAIVKGIADMHGGKVEVKSTPGAGSTFMIWLPLINE
ncbi:MAG TPA: ATP-binding protein [Anaerolineae bacterium]|nr:ATP-binding protein [Anaerolineae bacterium]